MAERRESEEPKKKNSRLFANEQRRSIPTRSRRAEKREWVEAQLAKSPRLSGEQLSVLRNVLLPRHSDGVGVELSTALHRLRGHDADIEQDPDDLPALHDA